MNREQFINDPIYETLAEHCDTIIYLEEVKEEVKKETISQEIYDYAIRAKDEFMKQFVDKMKKCATRDEEQFLYEYTVDFLHFSLMEMVSVLEDESIENLANEIRDNLLTLRSKK